MIISSRLSQLQVSGFLLTKYISLLYLYPLRSCFFVTSWSLILCLWAVSCRQAQTVFPSKSYHIMTCEWKIFQIKENRKVQCKKIIAQLLSNSFHSLISKGFLQETVHLCIFCRWGNTQKVQNHSAKQEWIRTRLWVSSLLASLLPCHFPKLLLSNRSLHGYFWWDFSSWVNTIDFDHLVFPVSLPKKWCVGRWDFF